jgi:hypothetical protein
MTPTGQMEIFDLPKNKLSQEDMILSYLQAGNSITRWKP